MLVRILNTLPSRIWDILFFLFSGYLNLQFGENGVLQMIMTFREREIKLSLLLCNRCILDARPHLTDAKLAGIAYIGATPLMPLQERIWARSDMTIVH